MSIFCQDEQTNVSDVLVLKDTKGTIIDHLPVWMCPFDVYINACLVFKHLVTGWAIVLGGTMYVSHVNLENISFLDIFPTNHADEACGTFLHLGLH
jgi:hypothetical protein